MINISLIEECRNGNLNHFRQVVEATTPFVFSLAFRMLADEEQAKDVTQETMITIWQKIKKIKSAEVYKTWTYRIAVNKCYDILRKRKRNPEYQADERTWALLSDTIAGTSDLKMENEEIAAAITILTERLSPKQKAVFILSEIDQLSGDEIAEITGMAKTAIKANLHYAKKNISVLIQKYL